MQIRQVKLKIIHLPLPLGSVYPRGGDTFASYILKLLSPLFSTSLHTVSSGFLCFLGTSGYPLALSFIVSKCQGSPQT